MPLSNGSLLRDVGLEDSIYGDNLFNRNENIHATLMLACTDHGKFWTLWYYLWIYPEHAAAVNEMTTWASELTMSLWWAWSKPLDPGLGGWWAGGTWIDDQIIWPALMFVICLTKKLWDRLKSFIYNLHHVRQYQQPWATPCHQVLRRGVSLRSFIRVFCTGYYYIPSLIKKNRLAA